MITVCGQPGGRWTDAATSHAVGTAADLWWRPDACSHNAPESPREMRIFPTETWDKSSRDTAVLVSTDCQVRLLTLSAHDTTVTVIMWNYCHCHYTTHCHCHHVTLQLVCMFVRCHRLTNFKSENIAEQMTLLDAQLFQKIEVISVHISFVKHLFYVLFTFLVTKIFSQLIGTFSWLIID